ncbi:Regulatory protein alcR [Pseudocercospora fuligena]|uniref:Regulatory protein alcR n=1 Tax=Pseudocercospora fuligena TaxID=685502 RepID=A0A8H6VFW9_9PEZI|nr:Regulatory protein alcR [Pseudocercospora fuligena]
MVKRVCSLDNEYSKAGLLSKLDHKEGSKVLNLVVLAFAAQWAQTGQRYDQPERFASCTSPCDASNGLETHTSPIHFLEEESFGRDTQKTLWYQANRALRAASDNNSFQAIFAGIIFSLTQRPIDSTEVLLDLNTGEQDELASLFNVLDIDGPTVTLDIALRKLHDHQRRLQGSRHPGVYGAKAPRGLSADHMETFGLLYWLAVMFDTLSAAMNRRSFTISDADTSVSRSERKLAAVDSHHVQSPSSTPDDADVWGDYFLREQSYVGDVRKTTARWPCDYVDAASCLADAAPVKVLLYRRLGHLQSLFYQRAPAQEIEESLEAAMEVYNHWNSTYALFIDDCIRNHEDLPARIQSWYTLLCGHWNLAVLMLLDLIDTLDNAEMTMPTHRHLRQEIHFTGPLRETAVAAISELGRCCCSGSVEEPLAFSQSPDFHSAVSKAALLTEPWTVVLVRAYGYAGAILANRLRSEVYEVADMDVVASAKTRERLRYCIEGLHLLGKKSDMALCAAELLSRAATT